MNGFTVCIIGGGPAGVAAALSLHKRGIRAAVIESSAETPAKIGETLPPAVKPLLSTLGIDHILDDLVHAPCYGNRWLWGSEKIEERSFLQYSAGDGWHLQRDHFERALMEEAAGRGIAIWRGYRLMNAGQQPSGNWRLSIRDKEGTLFEPQADFLVDATGRNSKLGRILGINRHQYDQLAGMVARFKPDTPVDLRITHIESVKNGWWYAAALANGEIVTAFMTDAGMLNAELRDPETYRNALMETKLIRGLFGEDVPVPGNPPEVQSAGTSRLARLYGSNWLAAGDAAQAFDPVSSYGITSSLGSGFYAGQAIADHLDGMEEALPAYRYVMEQAFTDYLRLWQEQYARETRWRDAPFWEKRRQPFSVSGGTD